MPYADPQEDKAKKHAYYLANRAKMGDAARASLERTREAKRQRRVEYRTRLDAIRRQQGGADCGTRTGPLDFHHVDGATKRFNVANFRAYSWASIEAEIAKCVVCCRSCHRKRHRSIEKPSL